MAFINVKILCTSLFLSGSVSLAASQTKGGLRFIGGKLRKLLSGKENCWHAIKNSSRRITIWLFTTGCQERKKRLDLKTVGVFCASKGTRYNCAATSNTWISMHYYACFNLGRLCAISSIIVKMSSSEIEPGCRYLWLSQICLNRFWLFKEISVRTIYHIAYWLLKLQLSV